MRCAIVRAWIALRRSVASASDVEVVGWLMILQIYIDEVRPSVARNKG